MKNNDVRLGYVLLYVRDVAAAVSFYESAFALKRRFVDETKNYAEMETGATRLGFVSETLADKVFTEGIVAASPDRPPLGSEIGLVSDDVNGLFDRAIKAGAKLITPPTVKPWGQTVAYLRDKEGHLVEVCSPMA